jgi:uncharacterized protein
MITPPIDLPSLIIVILGALVAGFTTGFAGFGTGLVASGLWFHVLPAAMVPPLVALTSIAGQLVAIVTFRKGIDWSQTAPYLAGGVIGVPIGVAALAAASPELLKTSIGAFLVAYAAYQLLLRRKPAIGGWGGKPADGAVGLCGGFLGGFAGLSGVLPIIWLQLRGGASDSQRATYQMFNFVVLTLASIAMMVSGQITPYVLWIAVVSLPATLIGAWVGARVYLGVSEQTFRNVVMTLLLVSGCLLIGPAIAQ